MPNVALAEQWRRIYANKRLISCSALAVAGTGASGYKFSVLVCDAYNAVGELWMRRSHLSVSS